MRAVLLVLPGILIACGGGQPAGSAGSRTGGDVGTPYFDPNTGPDAADASQPDLGSEPEDLVTAEDPGGPEPDPGLPDPGHDEGEPACEPGPCNDGDPCTINDACAGGACAGVPVDCDDAAVCTTDACKNGLCTNVVADGYCLIQGNCYSNGDTNPKNVCQRCAEPTSKTAWSDVQGPCDDGDPCTEDLCKAGQCVGSSITCPEDGNPCTLNLCEAGSCIVKSATGPCDDGDPCTEDDYCDKSVCVAGPPVECPEDPFPCTKAVCAGGECKEVPVDGGSCEDGDACTIGDLCSAGACVPGETMKCPPDDNGCTKEMCVAGGCKSQPVPAPCDDGDPCTEGDKCVAGACQPGPAVPGCGVVDECSFHNECNPAGVCAVWASTGKRKCSKPCAGPLDCPGQTCSKLPGSANIGFCQDLLPGGKATGAPCTTGGQCATGACAAGQCVAGCLDQAHCPVSQTCTIDDQTSIGILTTVCYPNIGGYKLTGQACTKDDYVYDSALCMSAHCNLLGKAPWLCSTACTSESDCPPGQECNIVLYSPKPNSGTLAFSPAIGGLRHDVFMGCYTQKYAGYKSEGELCSSDGECLSAKCMPLSPDAPATKYCTSFCTDDSECMPPLVCKLDALALTSVWLTDPENGSQPPQPAATTFVRVCRLP